MHRLLRELRPVVAATLMMAGIAVLTGMPAVPLAQFLLSSMGAGATVAPNEFNTLAEQLKRKEAELDAREEALSKRETGVARPVESREKVLGVLLAATGAIVGVQHFRKRDTTSPTT